MKTAVEWLEDNLISEPWTEEHFKHNSECWDKAKEMFEEQIIDAFYEDKYEYRGYRQITLSGEQYYNETFKSE